jgi:hypothetical protein
MLWLRENFKAAYDVMINYVPLPPRLPEARGLNPEIAPGEYPGALFDITLDLREGESGVSAVFTYADEVYRESRVSLWAAAFRDYVLGNTEKIQVESRSSIVESDTGDVTRIAALDWNLPQISVFADIWKNELGLETVTEHSDFFDSGGASMSAIRMESALYERGWYLTAPDIFIHAKFGLIAPLIIPAAEADWEADP